MSLIGPIYIGDTSIEEIPGSKFITKRGVANTLNRIYQGNADLVQSFLTANPLYTTRDYEYTYMVLDAQQVSYDGPLATINLLFVGFQSSPVNQVPNLQTSGNWEPRSVYLNTDTAADGEWLVNYYSPTITYKYTTNSIIDTPQYQAYSRNSNTVTILDCVQKNIPGSGPLNPNYVRLGNWVYNIYSVCTQFRFDQKGTTYNYQETWVVILQKIATQAPVGLPVGSASIPTIQ